MSNDKDIPKVSNGEAPEFDLDSAKVPYGDRDLDSFMKKSKGNFWKHTAAGRTLTLRNKTGKTIAGVLTTAVGVVTGLDLSPIITPIMGGTEMDFLADMGLIEIIITAATFLLVAGVSWIGAYFKLPSAFQRKLTQFIEVASTELEKAVDEESEKGRKVTRNEIRNGLYATFKVVFKKNPEELTSAK
jgi:hypothetical protein